MRASVLLLAASCVAVWAQSSDVSSFEVASIKPAPPPNGGRMRIGMNGGPGTNDPERFTAERTTIRNLITMAYGVRHYQLSGPDSIERDRFTVTAKVPAGATREQFRTMLQNLLAERFALKVHRETRQMPVYSLVVAKNGPKFAESAPIQPAGPDAPRPQSGRGAITVGQDGFPVLPPGGESMMIVMRGKIAMRSRQESMDTLVAKLADQLGRPVVDATGLKGKYDYALYWESEMPGRAPEPAVESSGPTIFSALQEQLGLKLETKKGEVEMLVVDHVNPAPTEN